MRREPGRRRSQYETPAGGLARHFVTIRQTARTEGERVDECPWHPGGDDPGRRDRRAVERLWPGRHRHPGPGDEERRAVERDVGVLAARNETLLRIENRAGWAHARRPELLAISGAELR